MEMKWSEDVGTTQDLLCISMKCPHFKVSGFVDTWTCPYEPVRLPNKSQMLHLLPMLISLGCQFLWRLRVSEGATMAKPDWLSHMWKSFTGLLLSNLTLHSGNSQDLRKPAGFLNLILNWSKWLLTPFQKSFKIHMKPKLMLFTYLTNIPDLIVNDFSKEKFFFCFF